ncbi:hypothetical protein M409DRAFT_15999 [Zasmidium cellare ATCC 36951]|uniref:Protoporphyrinogen oxidase n=1 Tax=Zasmidium cellare ATCC 36951 TaxID=1080233 RepID=A0A6A6D3U5_ZASCE|nr:uncharacterized protein M409DRAFT_15999 [Zasmidium cellare ATCC 36951]KAF2173725.1 hypothetical protein M409DRAFT_15999 [Zasmidium cellare ATCC 36951]
MLVRPHAPRIASSTFGHAPPRIPHVPNALLARPGSRDYSAEPTASHDVAVLGGGITGLACAYYLTRELPTAKVTIYEAKDHIGGWLQSKRVPVKGGSVLLESGPRTLRPQSNGVLTASLIQELDLTKDTIFTQKQAPAARNRYVYYPDHIARMPHPSHGLWENVMNLLREPVFQGALWAGAAEFWKDARDPGVQDESVGDFFSRRFSSNLVDRMLSAVMHGIYAGDVYKLSARSLFPGAWRDEGQYGSVLLGMMKAATEGFEMTKREADFLQEMKGFPWDPLLKTTLSDNSVFTFKDGLGMLTDRLYSKLFETGRVDFKFGTPVSSVSQAEGNTGVQLSFGGASNTRRHSHAVSALSPKQLNKATRQPQRSQLIPEIPSVTVMVVNLYFRSPGLHEPGFGYLIPRATPFENNPERALGVIFDNSYSPGPDDVKELYSQDLNIDELKKLRASDNQININGFSWYNMPDKPHTQDRLSQPQGTKFTVMLGGHWWDDWPAYPDEKEGLAMARSLLQRHLGITEEPEAWQVTLGKDCIPQYTVGHEQRLKQAHNSIWGEYKGRLRVAGNWMSGVGVNDCLRSARDIAKNFKRDATGLEHVGEVPNVRLKPVRGGQKVSDEE